MAQKQNKRKSRSKKATQSQLPQMSLNRWVQAGHKMNKKRNKTNHCKGIDLDEGTGWSNDRQEFQRVFDKLKADFKDPNNKTVIKDITGKNFAVKWCEIFDWFFVKYGYKKSDGTIVFDPEIICYVCNKYYSEHPSIPVKGSCKFFNARKLLTDSSQKNALQNHDDSPSHGIADGTVATPQDLAVMTCVYFSGCFNISMQTHPFMMYLMRTFGGMYHL